MSRVIKSSQITGEYRIDDTKIVKKNPAPEPETEQEKKDTVENQSSGIDEKAALIIEQAQKEAAVVLENAREEAVEILSKARENGSREGYEKGYQEGYAAGLKEGENEARLEADNLLQGLESALLKIKEEMDEENKRLSVEIVKLAINIASRIINVKLEFNPELINNIIEDMVRDMNHVDEIRISVSPEVMGYVNLESLKEGFTREKLKIVEDSNLKPADCIVKTELGGRDGTLENKLDLMERELLKEVGYHEGT